MKKNGILRVALMGGSMVKQEIAKYNDDVDDACNYCKDADSTVNHIRWQCKYLEPQRREQDPELAAVPYKYLLHLCTMRHCTSHEDRRWQKVLVSRL